jgi:hypothetical protein
MRDAVLQAFAANQADLARVATPETLDQIVGRTSASAVRFGVRVVGGWLASARTSKSPNPSSTSMVTGQGDDDWVSGQRLR